MKNKLTYEIQNLIANGKTEKAIKHLLSYLNDKSDLYMFYLEVIQISGLYKKKVNDFNLGLIDFDLAFNQINNTILKLLERIESKELGVDSLLRKKISNLTQKLIMTKDTLEIKRIQFELEQLKKHCSDEFSLYFLDAELDKLDIKSNEIKSDRNLTFVDKLKIEKSVDDFLSSLKN